MNSRKVVIILELYIQTMIEWIPLTMYMYAPTAPPSGRMRGLPTGPVVSMYVHTFVRTPRCADRPPEHAR